MWEMQMALAKIAISTSATNPVSQQTRHFMRDVISWQGSLAKLLHVWIFSRTRQLLHFSIRARQIRHLRMLLVRNTKTSLAGDFWSPYTNCTWCFPSRSKPCTAHLAATGRLEMHDTQLEVSRWSRCVNHWEPMPVFTLCKGYQQCHLHEFQLHLQYLISITSKIKVGPFGSNKEVQKLCVKNKIQKKNSRSNVFRPWGTKKS